MLAATGVAISRAANPAAKPVPMKRPTPTGRIDCDSTIFATSRVVAPSALRMPISLRALLDQVRQHAEQARQRQRQRQPAEHQRHPERRSAGSRFRSLPSVRIVTTCRPCLGRSRSGDRASAAADSSGSPCARTTRDVLGIAAARRQIHDRSARPPRTGSPEMSRTNADHGERSCDSSTGSSTCRRGAFGSGVEMQDLSHRLGVRPQLRAVRFGNHRDAGTAERSVRPA